CRPVLDVRVIYCHQTTQLYAISVVEEQNRVQHIERSAGSFDPCGVEIACYDSVENAYGSSVDIYASASVRVPITCATCCRVTADHIIRQDNSSAVHIDSGPVTTRISTVVEAIG